LLDHLEARKRYEQALATYRELDDQQNIGVELHNIAGELGDVGNLEEASAKFRQSLALNRQLGQEDVEAMEPKFERTRISFQLAQLIEDLDKRQMVLGLRSEIERLEYLVSIVPSYIEQRERTALAKRVAPLNGHPKVEI